MLNIWHNILSLSGVEIMALRYDAREALQDWLSATSY